MTIYFVGYNIPGYLPDNEPVEFQDLSEARENLCELIESETDSPLSKEVADYVRTAPLPIEILQDGLVFFLQE